MCFQLIGYRIPFRGVGSGRAKPMNLKFLIKRLADGCLQSRAVSWPLEKLWTLRRRVPTFPRSLPRARELTIEVTNICNANCVFCGYQYQDRPTQIMPLETFKMVVDKYVAIGGGMIELTPVVGDALVDKHFEEKVRYARAQPSIGRLSFVTNCILLTRSRFEALAEAGITHLTVSISGLLKEEYERVYRVDRYDTVIRNLTEIAASPLFPKVDISLGIRSDRIWGWKKDPDLKRLQALGYRKVGATAFFDNWSGRLTSKDLPGSMFVRPPRSKPVPCWQLYNSTTVLSDGRMTACGCRDLNGKTELALGSIFEQDLNAPWLDGRMEAIRQRFRDGNPPDVCRDCRHYAPANESG